MRGTLPDELDLEYLGMIKTVNLNTEFMGDRRESGPVRMQVD